jgi:hypothetical protein
MTITYIVATLAAMFGAIVAYDDFRKARKDRTDSNDDTECRAK